MQTNSFPKRDSMRLLLPSLVTAVASVVIIALPGQADSKPTNLGMFYGEAQTVGAGMARTYLKLENGVPAEIGIELREDALRTPPGDKWHPGQHPHKYTEYLLPLPKETGVTPFKLVELDWNPGGHEPPGIYDAPHLDFHFYTISQAERDAIDPSDPDYMRKAEHLPTADLVPAGYLTPPPITPFPRMGVHWAHRDAEESHGKPFRQTLIQGSWQGRMIFYEPMTTKAFLETKPDVIFPIAAPKCYQPVGYHPTSYGIRSHGESRSYRVSLRDFAYRGCDLQALDLTTETNSANE